MPPVQRANFDAIWKSALTHFLPDFFLHFYPSYWSAVDWSRGYRFLEQELEKLSFMAKPTRRVADKLASVYLQGRAEQTALFHVEIQLRAQANMAERMYDYACRLRMLDAGPVASFVLFIGKKLPPVATDYCCQVGNSGVRFHYEQAAVAEMSGHITALLGRNNPIALLAAAQWMVWRYENDEPARYQMKWQLMTTILEKRWSRRKKKELLKMVDRLLLLGEIFERRIWSNIRRYGRRNAMEWLCPLEQLIYDTAARRGERVGRRIGVKEGMEEGIRKGIKKGIQKGVKDGKLLGVAEGKAKGIAEGKAKGIAEGKAEGKAEGLAVGRREGALAMLERQLTIRFGPLSPSLQRKLQRADLQQLERWGEAILVARSQREVFRQRDSSQG